MSTEGATALFQRLSADESFRRSLEEASTPQDRYKVVTEAGFEIDRGDVATLKRLAGIEGMSDDDLAQVVGGAAGAPAPAAAPPPAAAPAPAYALPAISAAFGATGYGYGGGNPA